MPRRIVLVLGGARSGKSRFAEGLATAASSRPTYIATGRAWDDEMRDRIAKHRADRGERWNTVEAPERLVPALRENDGSGRTLLVDCLTLWVTNLMMAERDVDRAAAELVESLGELRGTVILVSNEVGMGIVPDNAMARRFRDHAGRLHQSIAAVADEVQLLVAGLPLTLKG